MVLADFQPRSFSSASGRRFRILNIVDHTRVIVNGDPRNFESRERRVKELTALVNGVASRKMTASHNGTEFTCIAMLTWSKAHGKPMHNGFSASTIGGGMCPSAWIMPGPICGLVRRITMIAPGIFHPAVCC